MIPYLVLADLQNTILAAILTFSDRVIYPAYAIVPTGSPSALDDQAMAGVIMWIPGSVIFLVAAAWLAIETLDGARTAPRPAAVGAVHLLAALVHPETVRFLRNFHGAPTTPTPTASERRTPTRSTGGARRPVRSPAGRRGVHTTNPWQETGRCVV
jgi:hypothetical protein